jgi:ubiquinone/menaquinone biosynthesis C-methylase UbiE/DNA-binding HxlR family transcriptional regulator
MTASSKSSGNAAGGLTGAEELQKVFKTFADPTRIRILRLLEQEELIVGELMTILGMAQSRVSRHLAVLREAGLLADRREGTFVAYRLILPTEGPWREAWTLSRNSLASDPTAERDDTLLRRALMARESTSGKNFFDVVGPEWDGLRSVLGDDLLRARATVELVRPGLRVADIGTGTGILALELATLGLDVVGIDRSEAMLETARQKWDAVATDASGRVEFRVGDAHELPLESASVDAAFAHMVLHSLEEPDRAIREMARVVRPGGQIILVDFMPHEHEWMKQELGLLWLGFSPDTIKDWIAAAGLERPRIHELEPDLKRDLPASFVAASLKPESDTA